MEGWRQSTPQIGLTGFDGQFNRWYVESAAALAAIREDGRAAPGFASTHVTAIRHCRDDGGFRPPRWIEVVSHNGASRQPWPAETSPNNTVGYGSRLSYLRPRTSGMVPAPSNGGTPFANSGLEGQLMLTTRARYFTPCINGTPSQIGSTRKGDVDGILFSPAKTPRAARSNDRNGRSFWKGKK